MHILFLTDNFPPETNAPASRTYDHAKVWVQNDHKVTIITCAPNFPKGEVHAGYRNRLWQSEIVDGITVIRVWTFIAKNEGFILRILDYLSFMVMGLIAALFVKKPDIIVGTSPQFFTACAAWATAAIKRKPFVFELRDIWPESIRTVGAMKSSKILDLFEKVELFLYRRARSVIAVTHSFKKSLTARNIDPQKIQIVTNGVDLSNFAPQQKDKELQQQLELEDKFVVGYVGTHGLAHALDTLLDAAKILQQQGLEEQVRMVLLGDGANREKLKARAKTENLKSVIFIESVPKNVVKRYWSLLDISIIHLKKSDLFKQVIPSKLFECMAMGIPILHGVEGESADIVTENKVGITFEPENATSLANHIVQLRSDQKLRTSLSENGVKAAARYDRKNLAQKMLEILVGLPPAVSSSK